MFPLTFRGNDLVFPIQIFCLFCFILFLCNVQCFLLIECSVILHSTFTPAGAQGTLWAVKNRIQLSDNAHLEYYYSPVMHFRFLNFRFINKKCSSGYYIYPNLLQQQKLLEHRIGGGELQLSPFPSPAPHMVLQN